MSLVLTLPMIALIGFCIFSDAAKDLCFKHAADGTGFVPALKKPLIWIGILLWGVELVAWTMVLEHIPLTIAFPVMSLVYVAVVFAGGFFLNERINEKHIIGTIFITIGVALIGMTGI